MKRTLVLVLALLGGCGDNLQPYTCTLLRVTPFKSVETTVAEDFGPSDNDVLPGSVEAEEWEEEWDAECNRSANSVDCDAYCTPTE